MTERDKDGYHLEGEELRRLGHAAIAWVADYWERVEQLPVAAPVAPGDVRRMLPPDPPEQPEPLDAALADLDRIVVPAITHWQSPNFFGYFPANASGPALLGDVISAGLGVNGMLWATSPAATELETHVLDWLVTSLGLPDRFRSGSAGGGVIQDSASSATLCALVAARERARDRGASLDRLTVYGSDQSHSSLLKGARIAGFAAEQMRLLPTDETFALRVDELADAIAADRAADLVPCFVLATAGTTSSMAFDPVATMGALAHDCGAWLHVDAAMAGSAAVCPELRWVNDGVEVADSYCFNPHKWLLTNFDCDCFWVVDRAALTGALSVTPEYLRNPASEAAEVVDYRDWQVPLGRRFRSLKLWFVLRHYGLEGLRRHIRRHVELTKSFANRILDDPRFELVVAPALNLVCFAHAAGDDATESLFAALNGTGQVLLTHTRLRDRFVIRACIGQTHTDAPHVDALWALIDRLAPS